MPAPALQRTALSIGGIILFLNVGVFFCCIYVGIKLLREVLVRSVDAACERAQLMAASAQKHARAVRILASQGGE